MTDDSKSALSAIASSWMDKESRREIRANPAKHAREIGMDTDGKEVVVATCTQDTAYLALDQLGEGETLSSAQLSDMQAAGTGRYQRLSSFSMSTLSLLFRR